MEILLIVIAIILLCVFVVCVAKDINYFRISSLHITIIIYWIAFVAFIIGMFTSIFLIDDDEIIHNYLKGNYKMEITIDSETNKADTVYLLK